MKKEKFNVFQIKKLKSNQELINKQNINHEIQQMSGYSRTKVAKIYSEKSKEQQEENQEDETINLGL